MLRHALLGLLFITPGSLWAQSSLLGLESGRYEIRSKTKEAAEEKSVGKQRGPASVVEKKQKTSKARQVASESQSQNIETQTPSSPKNTVSNESLILPSFKYNKLELWLEPSYIQIESNSNYSPRDYKTNLIGFLVGGQFWLSEKLSLEGKIMTSLGGYIEDDQTTDSNVTSNFDEIKLGVLGRHFYSEEYRGPKVDFKLHYLDSQLSLGSDAVAKRGFKSSGLGVGAKLHVPTSEHLNYSVNLEFYPRLAHTESTGPSGLGSGSSPTSSRIEMEFGGEYFLSNKAIILFGLDFKYEKNVFSGQVSSPDPVDNLTSSNVGVEFKTLMFKLGYRWGR
ncbi:MAG: hypothetical protein ACLGGX_00460 [Bdellovibrionia bacterium]